MDEADLIPLSALQHFLYCPRQCALIHVEQVWQENRFTAEGRLLHARTDEASSEMRKGVRTVTAMPIRSFRLGVSGIADVVELVRQEGRERPRPIEYKRGKPKAHRADEVQLCAQGMALEEMFTTEVASGCLFYGETRRRLDVSFTPDLRALTARVAADARAMLTAERVPHAAWDRARCPGCSLLDLCGPKSRVEGIRNWLEARIGEA